MSALAIKYDDGVGVSSGTNNAVWVDVAVIPAASLQANKEYVLICGGDADLNGGADECRFRVIRGSTVITHATIAIEEVNTADRPMWGQLIRDTQPGTAEDYKIQCQPSGTGAHTADGWLLAIPIGDLVENTDYRWAEVTADQTIPTAWDTSGAGVTFTPNGTDTYVVFACSIVDPTSATQSSEFGIRLDSGTPDAILILEGEDATNEKRGDFAMWTYTPSNASHTFRAVYQATAGAQTNACLRSAIFVLKLDIFDQFAVSQNAAEIALSNAAPTNIAGVDPNPNLTGDWVILGSARCDAGSLGEGMKLRLQVNAGGGGLVSSPNYGDDAPGTFTPDARDEQPAFLATLVSLTSGATREINLDAQSSVTNNIPAEDRCLVAFSTELVGGGTTLSPGGLTHTRGQGSPIVSPQLVPAGLAHSRGQGTPTVSPSIVIPSLVHTRGIGAPAISTGTQVSPAGLTHTRGQGSPQVNPSLVPAGLVHARALGDPTVSVPAGGASDQPAPPRYPYYS